MKKTASKKGKLEQVEQKKDCNDRNCPFHGNIKIRGRQFTGTVISSKMSRTVVVEWGWSMRLQKYERYEKKRTKIKVHNPGCIDAKEGDVVRIAECRPLSKTKNFVVMEKLGAAKGFQEMMKAREEAKKKDKVKKEEAEEESQDQ